MIDVHSTEFYVIAFVVAIALFTLLVSKRQHGEATSELGEYTLGEPTGITGKVTLTTVDATAVDVRRSALPLREGDTVCVVATLIDTKWHLVEKRGVKGRGDQTVADGTLRLNLPPGRYHVRYDSEISGQWCTFVFNHETVGHTASGELKF